MENVLDLSPRLEFIRIYKKDLEASEGDFM